MVRPSRHVDFFALVDALRQPGCPACRLADHAERRFLDSLFYEQVTDPETRARLRRAGGFCQAHTEAVLGLGDALGSSIIYSDLLAEAARSLGGGATDPCPACQAGAEAARRALSTLARHVSEEDVRGLYQSSDGLCLRHLGQLAGGKKARATAAIVTQIERERLQRLAAECAEFVAKSDYRRRGEALGPERNAWQRGARKLGGGFPRDGG